MFNRRTLVTDWQTESGTIRTVFVMLDNGDLQVKQEFTPKGASQPEALAFAGTVGLNAANAQVLMRWLQEHLPIPAKGR